MINCESLGVATDSFDAIITKLLKQTKPQDTGQLRAAPGGRKAP